MAGLPPLVDAASDGAVPVSSAPQSAFVRIPILLYHYVEVVRNPKDWMRARMAITPQKFEQQLQALSAAKIETLFVRDVPAILSGSIAPQDKVVLTFDDGYEDFYTDLFPLLKQYNAKATFYIVNDFIGKNDYLTEPQIREILASGLVEIGSHTLHHTDLRWLSGQEAADEILGSKSDLERRFSVPVTTFSYPAGSYWPKTVQRVRDAGFMAAVTTKGSAFQGRKGVFELRRLRPGAATGKAFLHLVQGK